jgi:hypothetical protein
MASHAERRSGRGEKALSAAAGILCPMPKLSQFDQEKLQVMLARQEGVVARRQVLDCAMSLGALRYRTNPEGRWQTILPGVYANARGRLSEKQRAVAAFLYAARPIAITGSAATAWHGISPRRSEFIDVLVPLG